MASVAAAKAGKSGSGCQTLTGCQEALGQWSRFVLGRLLDRELLPVPVVPPEQANAANSTEQSHRLACGVEPKSTATPPTPTPDQSREIQVKCHKAACYIISHECQRYANDIPADAPHCPILSFEPWSKTVLPTAATNFSVVWWDQTALSLSSINPAF